MDLRFSRSRPDLRSMRVHRFGWCGAEWELNEVLRELDLSAILSSSKNRPGALLPPLPKSASTRFGDCQCGLNSLAASRTQAAKVKVASPLSRLAEACFGPHFLPRAKTAQARFPCLPKAANVTESLNGA